MKEYGLITFLPGLIIFLILVYVFFPFSYGTGNNQLSVPLIMHKAGIADFSQDLTINGQGKAFTQETPLIFLLSNVVKLFKISNMFWLYFGLHLLSILVLFFALRSINIYIMNMSDLANTIVLSLFVVLLKVIQTMSPGFVFLGSEFSQYFFSLPLVFILISMSLQNDKILLYFFYLLLAIFSPFYAVLMLVPILGNIILRTIQNKEKFVAAFTDIIVIGLIGVGYYYYLYKSVYGLDTSFYDPVNISAKIAQVSGFQFSTVINPVVSQIWLGLVIVLLGISSIIIHKFVRMRLETPDLVKAFKISGLVEIKQMETNNTPPMNYLGNLSQMKNMIVSILVFFLIISFVNSYKQINWLVLLQPVNLFFPLLFLSWSVFFGIIDKKVIRKEIGFAESGKMVIALFILVLVIFAGVKIPAKVVNVTAKLQSEQVELVKWIKTELPENSHFLNYTNLDLRLLSHRTEYFRFDCYPSDGKLQNYWYRRYLNFYCIPDTIAKDNFVSNKKFADKMHWIFLKKVVQNTNDPINYILTPNGENYYRYYPENLVLLYSNAKYNLYFVSTPPIVKKEEAKHK